MIDIADFLDEEKGLNNYKVHFAFGIPNKREPLYLLTKNEFKGWQEHQNNKNFERPLILALIFYRTNEWIFGGVYRRLSVKRAYDRGRKKHYFNYQTELLPIHEDLIGRAIFTFKKEFRQSYVLLEKHYEKIILNEVLNKQFKVEEFPGYENVLLDFDVLKEIIIEEETSWKTALSNIKGVYIITDKLNGKQYIGSAYGGDAFWHRWKAYVNNGHGNNKELKKLLKDNGADYATNFQFSILEIRSNITSDEEIVKREAHWKDKLMTREFGYNQN